ncbi:cupin domain-containing protein [Deinococcus antarcticus]|uniref:Cupin domain-containing protein n=1 Tax=Deinococcus antarcticus TaxID=1298767 RepID=A0ABV8A3R3_9DEIO
MTRAAPPEILTKTASGRTLLFTLQAGNVIPPHRHPDAQVTIAVLSGEVEVTTVGTRTLQGGEVITHVGAEEVSMHARQASRVLVCLLNESYHSEK